MSNRTGILCAHGLKVLDLMNIKMLPKHYILKRWTREARNGSIQDKEGRNVVENPKQEAQHRYKFLSYKFHNLADKVSSSHECCVLLENALDCLSSQLEEKLNVSTSAVNEPCKEQENVEPNMQQRDGMFAAAKLKKKEVQSKNSRRFRTWLDKLRRKGKRKASKSVAKPKKGAKQQKKNDEVQPLVEVDSGGSNTRVDHQDYNAIGSFTQFFMAPISEDDILLAQDLF